MENQAETQALKARIQFLELMLKHKEQEVKNIQATLEQVLTNMSAPIAQLSVAPTPVAAPIAAPTPITKKSNEFKLIAESNMILRGEDTAHLTTSEYVIFTFLNQHRNEACTREQILENFKDSPGMTARNIDVHVFSLRKKLAAVNLSVETVWGIGYKLAA